MNQYPNYHKYLEAVARNNQGMLLVGIIAVGATLWLFNARFLWPKLLPIARGLIVGIFYGSLLLFILGVI